MRFSRHVSVKILDDVMKSICCHVPVASLLRFYNTSIQKSGIFRALVAALLQTLCSCSSQC